MYVYLYIYIDCTPDPANINPIVEYTHNTIDTKANHYCWSIAHNIEITPHNSRP